MDVQSAASSALVRTFGAIAIGVNVLITSIDVWMLFAFPEFVGPVAGRGLLIASVTLPLHLRHVVFGLRGERPPFATWTLTSLVLAHLVAFIVVGPPWMLQFASLVVSILIVVRGRWAAILVAAVVLSPALLLREPPPFLASPSLSLAVSYLVLAIAFRSVTQFVPVRLVGAIRHVEAARRELEARAVVRERLRIDDELRKGIGARLESIISNGEEALKAAPNQVSTAITELRQLVAGSRGALTEARRIVAGYQTPTVRANLAAAAALLETSGASVRVVAGDDVPLDAPNDGFHLEIRDALMHVLRGEPSTSYLFHVTRAGDQLQITVTPDERQEREPVGK